MLFWRFRRRLNRYEQLLETISARLKSIAFRMYRPGFLSISFQGASVMADKILYRVLLPEPGARDVVTRELRVATATTEEIFVLGPAEVQSDLLRGDQGTTVTVSLVDIDDAGNRSEASEAQFFLTDTLPPPKPGELAMVVEGEEPAEDGE